MRAVTTPATIHPQQQRHFSHCTGCRYTFVCDECKRVCGACFDTDPDDPMHQIPLCAECAHFAEIEERERNDFGAEP